MTYGYDEQTPTATSGLPQHNAVSGPRGNLTSSHTVINPVVGGATLDTAATYYDTGVPVSSTDPNGTTQYSYESTQGFATQITPPTPSSGVSLPATASYDVASGIPLSASDANNTTTPMVQLTQYDRLLRPKQINTVDGGSTTYNYGYWPGALQVGVVTAMQSGQSADTETQYDGYGRINRVAVANGQSTNPWYQVDYCYDVTGRLQFQPARYQGNGWSTTKQCSSTGTTYTYDALGRITNINTYDGNTTYQYVGRAVKTTSVDQVVKITQYDALGRIAAVCEVSSNAQQGENPVNCNLDIAGTGFLTTYAYDLVNHKTTITQGTHQQRIFQTDALGRTIYTSEPERGETTYTYVYATDGLAVYRTRPKANQPDPTVKTTTITQYDKVGRVVAVYYDDGITTNKAYVYDQTTPYWGSVPMGASKGHLTYAEGYGRATQFSYDSMGRVANTIQCMPGLCGTNSALDVWQWYQYDLAGNMKQFAYMTNNAVGTQIQTNYTYNPASQLTSISDTRSGSIMNNIQNGPNGPTTWGLGNGLNRFESYDWAGRPFQTRVCASSPSAACPNQVYANDAFRSGSNVTHVDDLMTQTSSAYSYDEFNRLLSTQINSWNSSPQKNFGYVYDRYGNRLQQNAPQGGPAPSYVVNPNNNQISVFAYDAAGNMANDSSHSYTYDAEGKVLQVDGGTTASYTYDALDHRVRTVENGTTTVYAYNVSGQRVASFDGSGNPISNQVYSGSTPVAFYQGGTIHYQHQDWLGTERVRTSSTGAVEGTYQSLSFGDGFSASGTDNDAYHFAALDRDADDTQHAQFRQYSSTQGRWMSPDPYHGSYDASNPQSFNRYTYVLNNPLEMVDPSGLDYCTVSSGTAYQSASDCAQAGGTWIFEPPPDNTGMCLAHCDGGPAPPDDPTRSYDPYSPLPPYIPLDPFSGYDAGSALDYSGSGGAPNNLTPANPCLHAGRAPDPSVYAQKGNAASSNALKDAYYLSQFRRGGALDAQVRYGGAPSYANYVFGVYMSAAGYSLSQALALADTYAQYRSRYPANTPMAGPNEPFTPQVNITNIQNGFTAQANGTTCHVGG
ncbi:MAG: RHS repeat protein [Acidobacteria bacterium]|nr:RHS repeat protein [Acidobacteriota bacterium]